MLESNKITDVLQANGIVSAVPEKKRKALNDPKDEPLSDEELDDSDAAEAARIKALEVLSQFLSYFA